MLRSGLSFVTSRLADDLRLQASSAHVKERQGSDFLKPFTLGAIAADG